MVQRGTGGDASPSPVRKAITDRVYAILRGQIIELVRAPGQRLQIEAVSQDLDVSQTPVREALNRLTTEGLVIQEPYRGFRVSDLLDAGELDELLATRAILEVEAAGAAADSITDTQLSTLRELVAAMDAHTRRDAVDVKGFATTDAEFHHALVAAGGNRFLMIAFEALHAHEQVSRHFKGQPPVEARRANDEHAALVEALAGHDVEAARSLTQGHIETVRNALQRSFEEEP